MESTSNVAELQIAKLDKKRHANSRAERRGKKAYGRNAITNGKVVLPDCDQRSLLVRRYRDIGDAIMADCGGADQCSESKKQLIRRFAAIVILAEQMESKMANGEEISIERHATLSSTLTRLASRIGIERIAKDVSPTLSDYLRQKTIKDGEV